MFSDFFAALDWTSLVIFGLTSIGGGLLIWYRKKFNAWRKFWGAVSDGLKSLPALETDMRGIRAFVAPDGGGPMMDSIRRMETSITGMLEQIEMITQTIWAEHDADEELGRWQSNAAGETTYVNQTYARWIGVGKAELLGWKGLTYVHSDDIDRVRKLWDLCRAERRQFRSRFRMVTVDGDVFQVESLGSPVPDSGTVRCWIGVIRRLDYLDRRCSEKSATP